MVPKTDCGAVSVDTPGI